MENSVWHCGTWWACTTGCYDSGRIKQPEERGRRKRKSGTGRTGSRGKAQQWRRQPQHTHTHTPTRDNSVASTTVDMNRSASRAVAPSKHKNVSLAGISYETLRCDLSLCLTLCRTVKNRITRRWAGRQITATQNSIHECARKLFEAYMATVDVWHLIGDSNWICILSTNLYWIFAFFPLYLYFIHFFSRSPRLATHWLGETPFWTNSAHALFLVFASFSRSCRWFPWIASEWAIFSDWRERAIKWCNS